MDKPSLIKTNSRYRGPTESDKYINMIHEILHDLRLLCYKIDSNEKDNSNIGHKEAIQANVTYYITGRQGKTKIDVPTATVFCSKDNNISQRFQGISPTESSDKSIKTRISTMESEIRFLLNNL